MSMELLLRINAVNNAAGVLAQLSGQLQAFEKAQKMGALGNQLQSAGGAIAGFGAKMALVTTLPIVAGMGLAVKSAMDFESSMADVNKILGKQEVVTNGVREKILAMSRTLPFSAEGLSKIAAAGGALGISAKDIAGFVEVTAKMGVAFDMTAQQAGEAIAKLRNVYSLDKGGGMKQVSALGDTINTLSNNMAAKAPDIVEAMTRIGGTTRTFGLSTNQTAALAASIISLGNAPEIAATAINSILPALQTAEGGTKRFKEGLQMAGISAKDMSAMVQKDGIGALQNLLGALNKLEPAQRALAINKMFGQGADARTLSTLANDASALSTALGLVADKSKMAGSMQKEFESRAATTANSFQLLKNRLTEVGINLGSALLPAINSVLGGLQPLISKFADFAIAHPKIIQIASAFLMVAAAIAPVIMAVGGVVSAIGTIISAVAAVKAFAAAAATWSIVSGAMAAIAGISFSPVLIGAAALAGLGLLLYKNWASVKAFFAGFGAGLTQGIAPAMQVLQWAGQQIAISFQIVGNAIASFLTPSTQAAAGARNLGMAFGQAAAFIVNSFILLPQNLAMIFASIGAIISSWIVTIQTTFLNLGLSIRMTFMQISMAVVAFGASIQAGFMGMLMTISGVFASISATVQAGFMGMLATISGVFASMTAAVSGAFSAILATVEGAMAGMVGAIASGASGAVEAIASMGSSIIGTISGIAGQMFEAGANIIQQLVNGIMSKVGEAQAAIANVASTIRGALPFSPAKWGPLSDIHRINLVGTIADNIQPAPMISALNSTFGAARSAMDSNQLSLPSVAAGTASSNGGSGVNVTYAPQISMGNGSGSITIDQMYALLQQHGAELVSMLDNIQSRRNRVSYS